MKRDIKVGDHFLRRNSSNTFGVYEVLSLTPSPEFPIWAVLHSTEMNFGLNTAQGDYSEIKARYAAPFVEAVEHLFDREINHMYTQMSREFPQRLLFNPKADLTKQLDYVPVPVNACCTYCKEAIADKDSGILIWHSEDVKSGYRPYHGDCFFRQICGSVKHQKGQCSCHGGNDEYSPMTLREEATAACNFWREHHAEQR